MTATGYYDSTTAAHAAHANARRVLAEAASADAEIAARSARLAPYKGRGRRYRLGIAARVLLWLARGMRALAATIRQHHANQ
jgi:hypothetical protein